MLGKDRGILMDVGSMELVLIFIIALIVFGPQRLVEIARFLGKTIREIRGIGTELTKSITHLDAENEGNDRKSGT